MSKKTLIALAIATPLVVGLAACSDSTSEKKAAMPAPAATKEAAMPAPAPQAATDEAKPAEGAPKEGTSEAKPVEAAQTPAEKPVEEQKDEKGK